MQKENCCNVEQKNETDFKSIELLGSPASGCDSNDVSCCEPNQYVSQNDSCCSSTDTEESSYVSDCDCDCDCNVESSVSSSETIPEIKEFDIVIDGKSVTVTDSSKNIVEIAKNAGIAIPAPCFLAKKRNGCCKACVIEINDKQSYACGTKPTEGMNIIVNREDLRTLRKERLLKYKEAIRSNAPLKC